MKTPIISALCILCFSHLFSQNIGADSISRKKITAISVTQSPKIDGILDEEIWKNAPSATNFIERRPNNGKPADESLRSDVKILYDDTGIYFGAILFDNEPAKIARELTERDNIENDDIFGITLWVFLILSTVAAYLWCAKKGVETLVSKKSNVYLYILVAIIFFVVKMPSSREFQDKLFTSANYSNRRK